MTSRRANEGELTFPNLWPEKNGFLISRPVFNAKVKALLCVELILVPPPFSLCYSLFPLSCLASLVSSFRAAGLFVVTHHRRLYQGTLHEFVDILRLFMIIENVFRVNEASFFCMLYFFVKPGFKYSCMDFEIFPGGGGCTSSILFNF